MGILYKMKVPGNFLHQGNAADSLSELNVIYVSCKSMKFCSVIYRIGVGSHNETSRSVARPPSFSRYMEMVTGDRRQRSCKLARLATNPYQWRSYTRAYPGLGPGISLEDPTAR